MIPRGLPARREIRSTGAPAARDAGIKVEKDVIDKSIKYVLSCQNPDGGFSYQSPRSGGGSQSGFARSAAGVSALYYAGVFEGDNVTRGLKYVAQFNPTNGQEIQMEGHYYYGNYYAVQAMFLAGGDYWARWYPAIRDELQARAFVARTLQRLGVIGDPDRRKRGPGRPGSGGIGITWEQLPDWKPTL